MSLRTALLPVVDTIRALTGPANLDIRIAQLRIETRVWTGQRSSFVSPAVTSLTLPQQYKIRQLTTREVASADGRYELGDIKVGPITPSYGTGGYTEAQLKPRPSNDLTEIVYVLLGSHAGEYQLVEFDSIKPFSWFLVLRRRPATP